jgi:hypothetical protein
MASIDFKIVVDILKVGLPGLVFLLSFLAYRLLSRVEGQANPSANVLKLIKNYMYINVALAVLTLTTPFIDYALSEKSETFNIEALAAATGKEAGQASVCQNVRYVNRYLLVKNLKTQHLIQVFASGVIPCTGDKHIVLSSVDAAKLGLQPNSTSTIVEVVTALPGYIFAI